MAKRAPRLVAALAAAGVSVAGWSALARADGLQAPWFQLAPAQASLSAAFPLSLTFGYVSFWHYADGFRWAQYNQWRLTQSGIRPIYATRPATPLPQLASQPDRARLPDAPPEPPAAPAPEPVVEAADPVEQAPAPVEQAPEPVEEAPDPVGQAPTPVEQAPEPVEEAPAPVGQAPAPVEQAPAPVEDPKAPISGLTAEEAELLRLVNLERTKAGLPVLTADRRLVATARAKSQDMIDGGYFGHDSPRLGSPFAQLKAAGIAYRTAAENIAGHGSVAGAHASLMNSPGHRANILNPQFTRIGIGIIRGGPYGLMITQQFTG